MRKGGVFMKKKKLMALSCTLMFTLGLAACSAASDAATTADSSAQSLSAANDTVYSDTLDAIKYNSVCYYGLNMTISLTDEEEAAKKYIGTIPSVTSEKTFPAAELEATETVFNVGDKIYYIETSVYGICFLKESTEGYTGLTQCTTTVPPDYYQ